MYNIYVNSNSKEGRDYLSEAEAFAALRANVGKYVKITHDYTLLNEHNKSLEGTLLHVDDELITLSPYPGQDNVRQYSLEDMKFISIETVSNGDSNFQKDGPTGPMRVSLRDALFRKEGPFLNN